MNFIQEIEDIAPRYEHDCDCCSYLGQFGDYDLYFCPNEPTVIARFGEMGEYMSGLEFAKEGSSAPLLAAKQMAIKKRLYADEE